LQELAANLTVEFMAYLYGDRDGSVVTVDRYVIPEQESTSCGVDVIDKTQHGMIGVFHTHPSLVGKPMFSSSDHETINQNHTFSIVMNKVGAWSGVARRQVSCGAWVWCDLRVDVQISGVAEAAAQNIHVKAPPLNSATIAGVVTKLREFGMGYAEIVTLQHKERVELLAQIELAGYTPGEFKQWLDE